MLDFWETPMGSTWSRDISVDVFSASFPNTSLGQLFRIHGLLSPTLSPYPEGFPDSNQKEEHMNEFKMKKEGHHLVRPLFPFSPGPLALRNTTDIFRLISIRRNRDQAILRIEADKSTRTRG